MKILFDQNTPGVLRRHLSGHEVFTARRMGWDRYENGDLLRAAEAAEFQAFITGDGKLRYQQNLKLRAIAIIELTVNNWPSVRPHIEEILAAVNGATPGSYQVIDCTYRYTGRKKMPKDQAEQK